RLAVISGRSLKDIKKMIGLEGIVYSGNHGLEIDGPKLKFESVVPSGFKKLIKDIKSALRIRLAGIDGLILEDKGHTLSVHYRMADSRQMPLVKSVFREITACHLAGGKIKIKTGKMMLEVRPPIEWDKGRSVMWLLARQKFISPEEPMMPVYIGDDVTDEDAFSALGNRGLTVFVGKSGKSGARYYLKDHNDVTKFLALVRDLKRDQGHAGTTEG
ncbi:MAG: trehalose-phosphatase, partial [Candidatus Omnitrophota bacterium]